MTLLTRRLGARYAFVVAAIAFLAMLVSAGVRATPGVLILPLEKAFGWNRELISLSAAIGIFLYGMSGPFAGALMERFGVRRVLVAAMLLMSVAAASSALMSRPWQLIASWGLLSGVGTGCAALVLGATIVNRWFVRHRGLVIGLLTASSATGTLVFLPALAALSESGGWRAVVISVAVVTAAMIPLALWLLPERPASVGLRAYGADDDAPDSVPRSGLLAVTFGALRRAARTRMFWLLFATFYVCGLTTNGLIGTHLIAMCGDHGIPPVRAAGLLAAMGVFDLVGTTVSGWLTDRYDSTRLLALYYAIRGLSLIVLPYSDFSLASLSVFAVFYGLDWVATVPPTLRLANDTFGDREGPIVFGWIAAGHQLGAATAAYGAGWLRQVQGDYLQAFLWSGVAAVLAGLFVLAAQRRTAFS